MRERSYVEERFVRTRQSGGAEPETCQISPARGDNRPSVTRQCGHELLGAWYAGQCFAVRELGRVEPLDLRVRGEVRHHHAQCVARPAAVRNQQ